MWRPHFRSAPLTRIQENIVSLPLGFCIRSPFSRNTISRPSMRCLATVAWRVTDPKFLNLRDSAVFSFIRQACNPLCDRTSLSTILCHHSVASMMLYASEQCILFPRMWPMAEHITVEDQVIDLVHRARACDLEEITRLCTNLTWNQVFLAVDGLSRSGEITLLPRGRGLYTVIFRQPLDGRLYPPSLPSSTQGGVSCLI